MQLVDALSLKVKCKEFQPRYGNALNVLWCIKEYYFYIFTL